MKAVQKSQRKLQGCPQPRVKFSFARKDLKGEDAMFSKTGDWVGDGKGNGNFWSVFLICDGHGGEEAAKFITSRLWGILKPQLPTSEPPTMDNCECATWSASVQRAIVKTFVQLEKDFQTVESIAGSTVTLALLCGWTLTVANLGDSDAMVDTVTDVVHATVSHRIDDSEAEKQRFREAGVQLARLDSELSSPSGSETEGIGPLRCWPGGLANGRAIGDRPGGEDVLAIPHIRQYLVPHHGARIILASDGLWDIIKHEGAVTISRYSPISHAADRVMTAAIFHNGWAFGDDTSIFVVEVSPRNGDAFEVTAKKARKLSGFLNRFKRAINKKSARDGKDRNEVLKGNMELITDVDGLDVSLSHEDKKSPFVEHMRPIDSASEMVGESVDEPIAQSLQKISIVSSLGEQEYHNNGYNLLKSISC